MTSLRIAYRLMLILVVSGIGVLEFSALWILGRARDAASRARWQNRISRRYLSAANVRVETAGNPPTDGMLVCNHLGYLDILVIGATVPATFISKHEVRDWPVFGMLARMGGTLFLRREKKSHALEVSREFDRIVEGGAVLGFFPEGTSSDGTDVLPFHSTLFQPAVENGWSVTPAWIGYSLPDGGSVQDDVCFMGDAQFAPHMLRLLSHRRVNAVLRFGEPATNGRNRKEMARMLRESVIGLGSRNGADVAS